MDIHYSPPRFGIDWLIYQEWHCPFCGSQLEYLREQLDESHSSVTAYYRCEEQREWFCTRTSMVICYSTEPKPHHKWHIGESWIELDES